MRVVSGDELTEQGSFGVRECLAARFGSGEVATVLNARRSDRPDWARLIDTGAFIYNHDKEHFTAIVNLRAATYRRIPNALAEKAGMKVCLSLSDVTCIEGVCDV